MRNLAKILIPILGLNLAGLKSFAQPIGFVDDEIVYANLIKNVAVPIYPQIAIKYLDSSFHALDKEQEIWNSMQKPYNSATPSDKSDKNEVMQALVNSCNYLIKCDFLLNQFIKKSRENYQNPKNKELNLNEGIELKLDTNEVKQLFFKIKKLEKMEHQMLSRPGKINDLIVFLLKEEYFETYALIDKFSKE